MTDDGLIHPVPFEPRPLRLAPRTRPPRRVPKAALLGLLVLLAGAATLLAARAVEVVVDPVPDRLAVSGLQLPLGRLRLLFPGRHEVRAEKAGFKPLEATFDVTRDPRQVARFSLERLPTFLTLEVEPGTGVRVQVNGAEQGVTPLPPLELPEGQHEVVLRAEGYTTHTAQVVAAGGGDTQTLRAVLAPDRAAVTFSSDPSGATVSVDGTSLGATPLFADLSSGTRKVEVARSGYRTASARIEVTAGKPLVVPTFRLEPLPGRVTVTTEPAGATVAVDGRFRGETPLELDLPAGEHAFKVTKAGHDPAEAKLVLERGETRPLSLKLAPQFGEVLVSADPADAEVVVDGEPKGKVGQTLRLTTAPHEIEVKREGYLPHRASLTPKLGVPLTLRVRLSTQKEAATAARPPVIRPGGHELRLLSGGRFKMGASRREPGRRANETLREAELVRPFYIGVREVTNAQFRRFKADHSSGRFGASDLGGEAHPVVQVTWEQAAEYCNWLSTQERLAPAYVMKDGKPAAAVPLNTGYRLPTEAEWSRAARYPGAGPLKFPWGPAMPAPNKAGNFADESARASVAVVLQGYDDGYPATAPVGTFSPNSLMLFDLGGNVAEWVHDVYTIPAADAPPERDPVGPPTGDLHVILGSSFLQGSVSELRLAYRDYGTKPRPDVGFRIARYAE